jgi:hypothetical protein
VKPVTKTEFLNWLASKAACSEAMDWAKKQRRGRDIVEKCDRVGWLDWLVSRIGGTLYDDYRAKLKPLDDDYRAKLKPLYDDYEAKRKPMDDDYEAKRMELLKTLMTWDKVSKAVRS